MRPGERRFVSDDGREWIVSLEGVLPGQSGPRVMENAGAMLPEESVRIVFRSGEETVSEEYTGLAAVEDLSESDLREWLESAREGKGL